MAVWRRSVRSLAAEAKEVARPSQVALGWDWTFYKMKHFSSFEEAQDYMNRKPVPYIAYDGKMYVIDHHHTLAVGGRRRWCKQPPRLDSASFSKVHNLMKLDPGAESAPGAERPRLLSKVSQT